MTTQTFTLGRGKGLFRPVGAAGEGYDDWGNITDFKVSFKTEKKEHHSYRSGLKVKDKEVILALDANISFSVDSLSVKNLQKFLMADAQDLAQTAGTLDVTKTVKQDQWFELGYYNLGDDIVVKDSNDVTTYAEGTDYTLDKKRGLIYIIEDGAISDGQDIHVTGTYGALDAKKLLAGLSSTIKGRLLFVGDPAVGTVLDIEGDVELAPEGDLELIGDDWVKMSFSGSFTKPEEVQHLYEAIVREVR